MSTIKYVILSLAILTTAIEAKKILRAQEGTTKTGKFMVSLDLDTPDERFDELAEMVGVHAADQDVKKLNGKIAKIITATLSESALETLKNEPNVKFIEEETMATKSVEWHLDRVNQRNLPLDNYYALAHTGAGVHIYVLDTGIRYSHNEFGGRASFSLDVFGGDGSDCDGHGTHVAGLAGGATYGIACAATLKSVRVLNCAGSGSWSGVIQGIDHAASQIASTGGLMSLSLGGGFVQAVNDAIENAVAAGAHAVIAAGNSNADACNYSPASAPSATTVGSTTITDYRSWFSNKGSCVDIFAPGSDITSAGHGCDWCTAVLSGTSMACPIVSSLGAIFLEVVPGLAPYYIDFYLKYFATSNVISDVGAGSPNLLLYTYYQYYAG